MRMRRKPWAKPELQACPFFVNTPTRLYGRWKSQFTRSQNPLWLELGCGKGNFAAQMALQYPQINLMAIDIKDEVLAVGRRYIQQEFDAAGREVDNLLLLSHEIELIHLLLAPEETVERIYINFCNPWPHNGHHKKRLTHPKQLILYSGFLAEEGEIWFKTDSDALFAASLAYLQEWGFAIAYQTEDLHQSPYHDQSPCTEHEARFTAEGIPTKFLIARMQGPKTRERIAALLEENPRYRPAQVPPEALSAWK